MKLGKMSLQQVITESELVPLATETVDELGELDTRNRTRSPVHSRANHDEDMQ
jgi:hypothetical protein